MTTITYKMRVWGLLPLMALGLTLTGCSTDDDIDLGDIDTNIGIGSDGLTLPTSSTNNIKLADVLELKEDGVIKIRENNDYYFTKADEINAIKPKVEQVTIASDKVSPTDQPVTVPVGTSGTYTLPLDGTPMEVTRFDFNGTGDKQIISLNRADVKGNINMTLTMPAANNNGVTADIKLYLPDMIGFENTEVVGGIYEKKNVVLNRTSETKVEFPLTLKELKNFKTTVPTDVNSSYAVMTAYDESKPDADRIFLRGIVKVLIIYHLPTPTTSVISGNISMGTTLSDIIIQGADGNFKPDINPEDSKVELGNDIPDFLDDPEVRIKLSNPSIVLNVTNNVDMQAFIKGEMTATYKDGSKKTMAFSKLNDGSKIMIDEHKTTATTENTPTKIVICRQVGTPEAGTKYVVKDGTPTDPGENDIQAMLEKIPETIYFTITPEGNTAYTGHFDLYDPATAEDDETARGRGYKIEPKYDFTADLNMDAGSVIVYNDTIDGWNEDFVDNNIELANGTSIIVNAQVNNTTPMKLYLTPTAIDVARQAIPNITVTLTTPIKDAMGYYIPSNLGSSANSSLKIELKSSDPAEFKKLEGLAFKVKAVTEKPGITLNSTNQIIKVYDMKMLLTGKININIDK